MNIRLYADFRKITCREKRFLLDLSRDTMCASVQGKALRDLIPGKEMENLLGWGSSFVTLLKDGDLRGCMGRILPDQPLYKDVISNTTAAMYQDPRFSNVGESEIDSIIIEISILSPIENLDVESESDLLQKLKPFQDGIILTEGKKRATFLPSVWESLDDPEIFLQNLKRKAGFRTNYWSSKIRVQKYEVLKISESDDV